MRVALFFVSAIVISLLLPLSATCRAASADADTVKLELEVDALTAMNDLHLTDEQFGTLKGMTVDTAGTSSDPPAAIAAAHKVALQTMKAMLLTRDQKKIDDAADKLGEFEDKQNAESNPDFEQSDAAKEKAQAFLKILSPAQIANYISQNAEDVHDPARLLLDAVHRSRGMSDDDFDSLQDDTAEEIHMLVAGPHAGKPGPIVGKIKHLLERVHQLSAQDYKTQQTALEDEARQIVGTPDPIFCLRHWMENELADLLSNPQLGLAINELSAAN